MGYIKKLKNNELVGGTDKTTIYPVTSTKAVFEEITNGNESSFKSQKTINGEHDDRIKDLEEEMPNTVKSITINGGQRINTVDENGNVDLTIYSDGGQDYEGLTEVVADLRDIVGENPEEPQSGTLLERVDTLEDAVGTGGSVDQRIETAINSLNVATATVTDDTGHVSVTLGETNGKIDSLAVSTDDIASAEELHTLDVYVHAIEGGNIRVKTSTPTNPDTGAPANTVYRVAGTTTYSDYMWNGTTMVKMAEYNVDTLESQFGYYKWETASNTISITTNNQVAGSPIGSYVLTAGGSFKIKMTNKATGACTLNMNGTGTKTLLYNGDPIASNNTWENDEVISVYYDGTNYQASNAQGGGGKAEKIKYDNSQSGLAAENVQSALDKIAPNSLREVGGTFVRGTITGEGADNTSTNTLRTGYIPVRQGETLRYKCNTDKIGVFIYNSNTAASFDSLPVPYTDVDGIYIIPHDGCIRMVVKNAGGTTILPEDRLATFWLYPPSSNYIYNNSNNGLVATNMQEALDNITGSILHYANGSFEQGGIYIGSDGSDNNTVLTKRIRSSYLSVKQGDILYIKGDGTQKVSIVSYDTNKGYDSSTGATGWYSDYKYIIPQDGFIRLLVANQDDTTNILVANLVFEFSLYPKNEYVLEEELKDITSKTIVPSSLPSFPGYPSADGTWTLPAGSDTRARFHYVLYRTTDMDCIKVDAAEDTQARFMFATDYAIPANGDSTYVCENEAIRVVSAGHTSGWVKIPSDCKYVVFVHTNLNVEYPPASIHVITEEESNDSNAIVIDSSNFKNGGISSEGTDVNTSGTANVRIRTDTYYSVCKGDEVKIDFADSKISIIAYDNEKAVVSLGWKTNRTYICEEDGYLRFIVAKMNSNNAISPSDFTGSIKIIGSKGWIKDYADKVPNIARAPRKGSNVTSKMFTLLTFSDIHINRQAELKRILDFGNRYGSYLDDIISLGDLQDRGWESDIAVFRELADDGAKNILQVIGNHDYYNSGATTWSYNTDVNVYNRFFVGPDAEHPWVDNWGVEQPADAATNGYLYWYKDYEDDTEYDSSVSSVKVPRKIRLVCLNTNNNADDVEKWTPEQKTWLEGVLADAKTNGYSVIIASHYKPRMTYINCNMSDKELQLSNSENYVNNEAVTTIQDFIDGGGKFICWLCGHEHNDYIGETSVSGTNQLVIGMSLAQCGPRVVYSVMDRVEGSKSQDLFNVVGFDTYNKHIRILRIGADMDIFMRSKKTLCINYETHQIIGQS